MERNQPKYNNQTGYYRAFLTMMLSTSLARVRTVTDRTVPFPRATWLIWPGSTRQLTLVAMRLNLRVERRTPRLGYARICLPGQLRADMGGQHVQGPRGKECPAPAPAVRGAAPRGPAAWPAAHARG